MSGCDGMGMLCMKKLKRLGDSIDPCKTPLGKSFFADGMPLWSI